MLKKIFPSILIALCFLILALSIKGSAGDPLYFQTEKDTRVGGPFESTNSNSRYALTEAIVEYGTFFFNDELAKFAAPDIVKLNNKYFSIFTPGIPFVGVPFYILGKSIGFPQLTTYMVNLIFATLNFFLVARISQKLGAGFYSSFASGLLFLFATSALAYATTFTQHHVSGTILLLSLINAVSKRTTINNLILGALFGFGLLVDIPNGFMLLPIIFYAVFKLFTTKKDDSKMIISLKTSVAGIILGLMPFLVIFAWYNHSTSGSFVKIGQMIGRSDYPVETRQIQARTKDPYGNKVPYNPRKLLSGLYILSISNERGWFYYSPIILVGLLGLYVAYKDLEKRKTVILILSVLGIILLSYSMFGDPWGGWSFGPRYLIPASALASTGIGVALTRFNRNILFAAFFMLTSIYSLSISAIGAMTTNAIPPKVEAVNLSDPVPYTYKYNLGFVKNNSSSSLIYNLYASKIMSLKNFIALYVLIIFFISTVIYFFSVKKENR